MEEFVEFARRQVAARQVALTYVANGDLRNAIHAVSLDEGYANANLCSLVPIDDRIWTTVAQNKSGLCLTHDELLAHPSWRDCIRREQDSQSEHSLMRGWLVVPVLDKNGELVGLLQATEKSGSDFARIDFDHFLHLAVLLAPMLELQENRKRPHVYAGAADSRLDSGRDGKQQRAVGIESQSTQFVQELKQSNDVPEQQNVDLRSRNMESEQENAAHQRTEESLRESERRFRTIAEMLPALIAIFQGTGHAYANPEALRITGYTLEELVELPFVTYIHPDFQALAVERATARQRGR